MVLLLPVPLILHDLSSFPQGRLQLAGQLMVLLGALPPGGI